MSYLYLDVRADAIHSRTRSTSELRAFLRKDAELIERSAVEFGNSAGAPWLSLTMVKASPEGNFAVSGIDPGELNLVELIGSASEDPAAYWRIAERIAACLGWEIVDVTP